MPKITQDVADKAAAIGSRYNATVSAIRGNADLTREAKQRQIAQAYSSARRDMEALKSNWEQSTAQRRSTLMRDVFGSTDVAGADAISFRDAADRAAQIESPDDALRILERARNTGDNVLARAVAQHSFEQSTNPLGALQGWSQVVDAFAQTSPSDLTAGRVQELSELTSQSVGDGVMAAMHFGLHKPDEIGRLGDHAIDQMAVG